jgi:hypothetical protein
MVEMESDAILADAQDVDVCFLVVGDPFGCVRLLPTSAPGPSLLPTPFPSRVGVRWAKHLTED